MKSSQKLTFVALYNTPVLLDLCLQDKHKTKVNKANKSAIFTLTSCVKVVDFAHFYPKCFKILRF